MASTNLESVVGDPSWLAHRFDATHDAIHFVRADRATRRGAIFLTDEYLPQSTPAVYRREGAIVAAPPPAPVNFILHSAFCCSTLLARAFDLEGIATSFKEPTILNDIAGWRTRGATEQGSRDALDSALRLLCRPFEPGEAAIVKPSNVVNVLAVPMLAMRPSAHAVFLYAPLPLYLNSIARKGLTGKVWTRDLFVKQLRDKTLAFGLPPEDLLALTDLQAAAASWLAQQVLLDKLTREFGAARIKALDSETLVKEPDRCIGEVAGLFGLKLPATATAQALQQFGQHSKTQSAFGAEQRRAEQDEAEKLFGTEIQAVVRWTELLAERVGAPLSPASRLL